MIQSLATSGPVLARTGPDWTSPHESLATVNTAHDMGCARSGSFARFCHWSSLPYVVAMSYENRKYDMELVQSYHTSGRGLTRMPR